MNNVDITPAGTIGGTAITVAQMPAHTHGRGTTDIKGNWEPNGLDTDCTRGGAFLDKKHTGNGYLGHNSKGGSVPYISFQASSGWSGASESKGSGNTHSHGWTGTKNTHGHTFTGTKNTHGHTFTGTASTFSPLNPYKVAYCFRRIS